MAAERPYRDTVTLPSVLVMAGEPWPSDFYARCPQAFRVPVQVVWREGTSRDRAPLSARGKTVAARPAAGDPALPVAKAGSPGGAVAEVPSAGSSDRGGDPVGTFLRINDTLDRAAGETCVHCPERTARGRTRMEPNC